MTEIDRRLLLGSSAATAALVALPVTTLIPSRAFAIPLKTGTWRVYVNGGDGGLVIKGVDMAGNIFPGSTLFGDAISGFWHEARGRISFISIPSNDPEKCQRFTGFVMPGGITMAGAVLAMAAAGGAPGRDVLGWYAQFRSA